MGGRSHSSIIRYNHMAKGKPLKMARKKLGKLIDRSTTPIETFEQLRAEGYTPKTNNDLTGLQDWHMDLVRDHIINGMEYGELAKKYDCTREWASVICRSDVGVKFGKEVIEKFDIQAVRKTFQILTSPATMVLSRVIKGHDDGIDELDRAKLCLDVIKAGGIAAPKEHKFKFEHIFKEAGDRLEENERLIAGEVSKAATQQVMEAEVLAAVFEDDEDGN